MTERMNLNMDVLNMVTGGSWSPDTLPREEYEEYLELMRAFNNSLKYDRNSPERAEALANINAFFKE